MTEVIVADYGVGNLYSVVHAFESLGVDVSVTQQPAELEAANRIVIPGVGGFANCMSRMDTRGITDAVLRFADTGRPILGICVGMQMLFDSSSERGSTPGLGLIKGTVGGVPGTGVDGAPVKLPNTGWASIQAPDGRSWDKTFLSPLCPGEPVYFMHGFVPSPDHAEDILATTSFHGHTLCAAVRKDQINGVQFHPERSAESGLAILRSFAAL